MTDPQRQRRELPEPECPLLAVNTSRASIARMYDYLLGGKDNFTVDREAVEELTRVFPKAPVVARDNRQFLQRTVRFLAAEIGIEQFLDIGTGFPTAENVHEVAHHIHPGARVVYVDYDPVVISHAQCILASQSTVAAAYGDLRDAEAITSNPVVRHHIDFSRPFAVILTAVAHFLTDDERPHEEVQWLKDAMPPGSHLVLSHATADDRDKDTTAAARQVYAAASAPITGRSRQEITKFFDGLELVEPGVVSIRAWHPDLTVDQESVDMYGGVGLKRW